MSSPASRRGASSAPQTRAALRGAGIAVAALLLASGPAAAQTAPVTQAAPGPGGMTPPAPAVPAAAPAPLPVSMTIAGGVSLGAYEAGLAYYALESLRANPGLSELKLVTGASAGSVNGFISLLQSCGAATPDPRQSLFWTGWIPLGFEKLTAKEGTGPTAAFSRAAFQAPLDQIQASWRAGLRADCDVVYGLSVTRLEPRMVSLKGERLQLPRVEEHFIVRVQGRGQGKAPRLTNYADPGWEGEQALLPEGKDGEVPFEALMDAIFASTAFPGAFPPQPVRHCVVRGGGKAWPGCPEAEVRTDLFVDGGVFDNTPIRLASERAAAGLGVGGDAGRWRSRPDLSRRAPPEGAVFTYVSTDVRTFPPPDLVIHGKAPTSILGVAAEVGASFYDSARAKNLLYVHDETPEFFERLVIPERHLPAASSPLGAFFGFFETELRAFDFALGMYDARKMGEARMAVRVNKAGRARNTVWPEAAPAALKAAPSWQPYRCLTAVLDAPAAAPAACQDEALQDFKVVLQSSLERLWDRCRRLEAGSEAFRDDPRCAAAAAGAPPLQVPGVEPLPDGAWHRRELESEAAYTMRLLAAHRFEFKDLGLTRDQAAEAPARLRRRLLALGDQVADSQPIGQAGVMVAAVKMGADQVIYVPPSYTGWALYGRDLEVGVSVGFTGEHGLIASTRLHAALQANNMAAILSSQSGVMAFSALAGVEVLPAALATSALQPSLVLRGGYLFSEGDGFGLDPCRDPGSDEVGSCSRPVVGLGVAATALEKVRLQLFFNFYPSVKSGQVAWWTLAPGLGVQWGW